MDWRIAKFALDVLALLLSAGAWIYAWRVSRRQAQRAEIDALRAAIDDERGRRRHDVEDIRERMARAETRLDDTPTARAIHELAISIAGISGDLKATVAELKGLGAVVQRLDTVVQRQEEYLLHQAGKR